MDKRIEEILNWINEDIDFQERCLTLDYEKDKPSNWRIIGMRHLKELILVNFDKDATHKESVTEEK